MKKEDYYTDDELRDEYPTLFGIPRDKMLVPEGYFEEMASELALKDLKSPDDLVVPEGFFTDQLKSIEQRTTDTSQTDLSTPDDFFEGMHQNIMRAVEEEPQKSIVVSMRSPSQWKYWLAAACILGGIAWFSFFAGEDDKECLTFACLLEQTELTTNDLMFIDDSDLIYLEDGETEELDMIELEDDDLLDYIDEDIEYLLLEE